MPTSPSIASNPFDSDSPPSSSHNSIGNGTTTTTKPSSHSSSSSSSSSSTSVFASAVASPLPSPAVSHASRPSFSSSSASSSRSTPTASAVVSAASVPPPTSAATTITGTGSNTTETAANSSNNHYPLNREASSTPTGFTGSTVGSISRRNRRSLAAIAREKTTSALASFRASAPTGGLSRHTYKQSQLGTTEGFHALTPPTSDEYSSTEQLSTTPELPVDPSPHKMHQTSSRLLRMTEDDRPFTKDFMDLFSTLMVSLKLESHRVRFTRYDHSFTSEEAINNLGSLKFSQSNRMPDPKDPSRIVTTTTTTTFSMAKEMARSVCQRFLDARFIEATDGKALPIFPLKGAVFQLTPKGINILQRFCQRNGITARHVIDVLESPRNTMQLVNLERDIETDKLSHDRATIEVIFRRFAGQDGPNVKTSTSNSDSDSLSDYSNGIVGVKVAKERKLNDKTHQNTFTGKAAVDWLMDCSTTIERRETVLIAELFIKYGLITMHRSDDDYPQAEDSLAVFQPSKYAIYGITERGQRVCGWLARDKARDTPPIHDSRNLAAKDSNNTRLQHILTDPALRLLFREFLRFSLCEENLSFYLDVSEFTSNYRKSEGAGTFKRSDAVRETLASAYGLYNAFLAPGSPCELNIDHALRNSLAGRMTKAVGDDESMLKSLQEVEQLFEMAQTSVFKLMSSDSVPKFLRDPKYTNVLQEHDIDLGVTRSYSPTQSSIPERSTSKSARS